MRVRSIAQICLIGLMLSTVGCGGAATGTSPAAGASATSGTPSESEAPTAAQSDGAGGSTAGASDLDVCNLISSADVEAIIGEPPEAGIDESSVDLRACSWMGSVNPTESVTISIYVHPDAGTAKEQFEFRTSDIGGVEILNLGDEAVYVEAFGLQVLSGRYDIGIDNTGDDSKTSSLKLAQQILPKLP